MSNRPIKALEAARAEAERWLDAVRAELGGVRRHRAYSALRATLHAVRDLQSFDETVRLAQVLPPLLRGLLLEGWHPRARRPERPSPEDFLALVAERLLQIPELGPERAVRAVFAAFARGAARGELPPLPVLCPEEPTLPFWPGSSPAIPAVAPAGAAAAAREEIRAALERARAEGAAEGDLPELREAGPGSPRGPGREGDVLGASLQKTALWVRDFDARGDDPDRAFTALTGVLQALRDRLTRDEALHLGSQLPMVLRGFSFEAWSPEDRHKERTKAAFLALVAERVADPGIDPEAAARDVFALLARRVAEGEIEDVRHRLPGPVRALWPVEPAASRPAPAGPRRPRRAGLRRAKKDVRTALARARARGVTARDLPVLASRRSRSGR